MCSPSLYYFNGTAALLGGWVPYSGRILQLWPYKRFVGLGLDCWGADYQVPFKDTRVLQLDTRVLQLNKRVVQFNTRVLQLETRVLQLDKRGPCYSN